MRNENMPLINIDCSLHVVRICLLFRLLPNIYCFRIGAKRLMLEAQELKDNTEDYWAQPIEDNLVGVLIN